MKKKVNKGFMLAETLVVTAFVAGILIFLYVQFSNLNNSYDESYKYNTVEGLYALEDIKNYIENDESALNYIEENIESLKYINIEDCSIFTSKDDCLLLLKSENINSIFITTNLIPYNSIDEYSEDFLDFVNKINEEGNQPYRIVAAFNNSTYATLRFGE